ncbi:hypothetical protein Bca101_039505 [Brassica carinata]
MERKRLHLDIEDTKGRSDIGFLIGIAFSRHVRELVLHLFREDQDTVKFPSVLCSYNITLERLTIEEDCSTDVNDGGYVINAPSLKYLSIECLGFIDFCLIENAPELVEANIKNVSHIANENIIASLTSAKCLSFHLPLEIKCPTGSIFYQLVSLELHINEINGWNLLSFMLDSSPKLQILKLFGSYRYRERCPVSWEWTQPKCVPKCLLLHLETLVWTRYGWQREDEKQVATYILKNAKQLKKATFYPTCVGAETAGKVGKEARDAQRVG